MPDARNKKYINTWTGKYTKWDYKVEIILPPIGYSLGGLPLNNPVEIPLPIGAVRLKEGKVEYKDFYVSTPEVPSLSFDIDFDRLVGSDFLDLKNAFFEESPLLHMAIELPGNKALWASNIQSGIVFNLYIKFNGNDENSPVPFRLIRTCIHQADGSIKLNPRNKTISIEALDINKQITASFPWKELETIYIYDPQFIEEDTVYFELGPWLESGVSKKAICGLYKNNDYNSNKFEFVKQTWLFSCIADTGTEIKKLLMRDESQTFDLSTYIPTLYKQLEDATGNKGDELANDDILILAKIFEIKNESEYLRDGLFFSTSKNSLNGRYPNGAWDFISELGEFAIRPYRVGPTGITTGFVNFSNIEIDLFKVDVKEIEIQSERYKTITSSCYEAKSDEVTGGDLEKWDETIAGGRNEASWTIPMVFNNVPSNVKTSQNGNIRDHFKYKIMNFYYKHGPINDPSIMRCHEWAKFVFAYQETNNKSSDDYNTFTPVPRSGGIYSFNEVNRTFLACQNLSGIPLISAKTMKSLLEKGLDKIQLEVSIKDHVNFVEGGGGSGFVWNFPEYHEEVFSLNIAEVFGITYTKDNWKMLISKIDWLNEKALITLVNLNL